jgi:hypothetical protein
MKEFNVGTLVIGVHGPHLGRKGVVTSLVLGKSVYMVHWDDDGSESHAYSHELERIPPVHEEVILSPEGVEVWEQVMDTTSPIGKPKNYKPRHLEAQ